MKNDELIGQKMTYCDVCGRSLVGGQHRCCAPYKIEKWFRLDHISIRLFDVEVGVFEDGETVLYRHNITARRGLQETFAPTAEEAVAIFEAEQERQLERALNDVRYFILRVERARVTLLEFETALAEQQEKSEK